MYFLEKNATTAAGVYRVLISPDIAEKILVTSNNGNRTISEELVRRMVKALESGKWIYNGQPIIFDENGCLIDGQHRLTAISRAQMSVECLIVTGIDNPMAFHTLDDGKKRGLPCNLSAMGISSSKSVAAIGKLYYGLVHSQDITRFVISTHTEQNIVLAEFIRDIPGIEEISRLAARTSRLCNTSVMGAALLVFMSIDPAKALEFHKMLHECQFPFSDHPVKALHNRLLRDRLSTVKMNNLERLACIFKAWNYWRKGKSVKSICWSRRKKPEIKFPVPYGWNNHEDL